MKIVGVFFSNTKVSIELDNKMIELKGEEQMCFQQGVFDKDTCDKP